RDWGLYTTVWLNLERLERAVVAGEVALEAQPSALARTRIRTVRAALEAAPKTLAWKVRARVGKRLRWYQEVEEVQR
ncbi:MAG: hypothetical protein ACP5R2_13945, partial [Anaerolineae bacterium]